MLMEVWRNITDAQSPFRIRTIGARYDEFLEWFGVLLIPACAFFLDRLGVAVGMIVQGKNHVAMDIGSLGVKPERRRERRRARHRAGLDPCERYRYQGGPWHGPA